ncbi:MAG: M48 family metalloprotease [Betaproteobacteria bacterium]|nr:M48 family metalloprotease [Betaproteobacteria bacterium]MDE1955854.1 M48 family metalloprotease [Betaproteobacteria bacterium]MDE2153838.1 M48 family metalloprotease [Betaproteobacteria bacterium]
MPLPHRPGPDGTTASPSCARHAPSRRTVLRCLGCAGLGLVPPAARAELAGEPISQLPALGDAGQGLLSPAVEQRLGERIMGELRRDPAYLRDVLLREYLQDIVDSLRKAALASAEPEAPRHFEVFLLRDPTFNAFALPGGHIGVHTGLVVDAQARDQVAAVFAHEMSHITQRHVEQRLARAGADGLLSIGSLVLGVLAAIGGSGQAAEGLMMGGQAAALDRELRFSRNNERDADRVGTSVLRASGYPPQAMASMLERLQSLSRLDDSDVYAFLQDHPLTSERIGDAEARGGNQPLPPDTTLSFWLMNARARALEPTRADDLRRLARSMQQPQPGRPERWPAQHAAWAYCAAMAWLGAGDTGQAEASLDHARQLAAGFDAAQRVPLDLLQGDLLLARHREADALALAQDLRKVAPASRAVLHLQARALLASPSTRTQARDFLREQTVLHPRDEQMWTWLAQAYAACGQNAAQHRATAEAYALDGNLEAALLQLHIAQRTPGADYFEASIIDARLRALQQRLDQDKALDKLLPK